MPSSCAACAQASISVLSPNTNTTSGVSDKNTAFAPFFVSLANNCVPSGVSAPESVSSFAATANPSASMISTV